MKIIRTNKFIFQLLSVHIVIFFSYCTKQEQPFNEAQKVQNAIAELKKIVGNNGAITVPNNPNLLNKNSTFSITDTSRPITLSLEQFKEIYKLLKEGKLYDTIIRIKPLTDTSSIYKPFDIYDGDGPGPRQAPGEHFVYFSPAFISFYNGNSITPNPSTLSFLGFNYQSNNYGFVIGNPTISFLGLQFFGWNQTGVSQIIFNKNLGYSSFTINGTASFGISAGSTGGNIGLGWKSVESFTIYVYTDGTVSISCGFDGIK